VTELYIDGGCSGNNQPDMTKRRMIAAVTDADGQILMEDQVLGRGSNNIAELWAVMLALTWCVRCDVRMVRIYTDSRNNLSWVFGRKVGQSINDREMVLNLKAQIAELQRGIALDLFWVPREQNLAGHYIEAKYHL
jgi:ribonuclease HI